MGGLEVIEHEVNGIRGCADEDYLEDGVVKRLWVIEGPKQVDIPAEIHNQVEELRFERDT